MATTTMATRGGPPDAAALLQQARREQQALVQENQGLATSTREVYDLLPRVMGAPEKTGVATGVGSLLGITNSLFGLNSGLAEVWTPAGLTLVALGSRLFMDKPDALELSQGLVDTGLSLTGYLVFREGTERVTNWIKGMGKTP